MLSSGLSMERTLHGDCSRMSVRVDAATPSEGQVAYSQSNRRAERDGQRSYCNSLAGAVVALAALTPVHAAAQTRRDAAPG